MGENFKLSALTFASSLLVASCGGSSDAAVAPPPNEPTNAERAAAATATATTSPSCSVASLNSYYWEIGDRNGALASGSVGPARVDVDSVMNIASASKWLFAGYVVEKHGDSPANVPFLHLTSGYSNFSNVTCLSDGTVSDCMNGGINAAEATSQAFHYQGGHMQQLAVNLGLGVMRNDSLAAEVRSAIGSDVALAYVSPQPPGGVRTSARNYAVFLRKLLVGSASALRLGPLLGSHAVCTSPSSPCNASSDNEFIAEPFDYSLGHWIENNPATTPSSNFAYSSAGAFGFYPWVDIDRNLYGIVAREDGNLITRQGYVSLQCGRLIRLAWKTGMPQ